MKQLIEDHGLRNMAVPTAGHSHHQAGLRRVLVSRAAKKAAKKQVTLQGVLQFMKVKNVLTGAGVVSVFAVAVLAFSAIGPSQGVSAKELAKNSANALAHMTTSAQESEYTKFYPYFVGWMQQAQEASDLRLLTYDEVVQAYPDEMSANPTAEPLRVIDNPADGTQPNVRELRYLEFTMVEDGVTVKVVVGVNSQNIPEAALYHAPESHSVIGG